MKGRTGNKGVKEVGLRYKMRNDDKCCSSS